jgi:DNA-binding NarL/FixJ family response regulator
MPEVTIKVLIADDHGLVAEGLRSLIKAQPDMDVIGLAGDGREAVHRSLEMKPDVVVMDNSMPLMNGIEAARKITERDARIRVVMLSMHSNTVHVCRALQAGARGYVLKESLSKELVDAIRTVHSGRRYLSPPLTEQVIDQLVGKKGSEDPLERLSARERQVLQMLAEGIAVVDIAQKLSLSPKSVETYRARMMEKLEIYDLAGLVKFAIQQGISSLD